MSTIARKQAPSSAKRAKKPYTARRLYKSTKRTQRSAGMKYPGVGSKIGSAVGSAFGPAGSLLGGALEGVSSDLDSQGHWVWRLHPSRVRSHGEQVVGDE